VGKGMVTSKLYIFIPQPFSLHYARFVVVVRTKFWANLLNMFWSNKASIISEVVAYTGWNMIGLKKFTKMNLFLVWQKRLFHVWHSLGYKATTIQSGVEII
jgi:hypothetical protein